MAKVLVAEDERDIRELLVDILFDAGFDVVVAENGVAALEKVGQEQPDIVLLDVGMPVMDGFQVLRELRADPATESMPVVLLTAMPAAVGEAQGLRLGVLHYVSKPWPPGAITDTVRVALRESQATTHPQEDSSKVWAGSKSYARRPDDVESQRFIKTDDALDLLGRKLGGGISVGSLMLIEGAAVAGKSVVCQHLVHGALQENFGVVYFSSEHTSGSLIRQMESIGLSVSRYVQEDHFRIYPVEEPVSQEDSGPLLSALALDVERLDKGCQLVVLDSVTQLANYCDGPAFIGFFASTRRLCTKGRTVIVVTHSHVLDDAMVSRLSSLCDRHLRLRTGKVRSKVVRMVEVIKANNVELDKDNQVNFEVEAGSGIKIIPYSQVKA